MNLVLDFVKKKYKSLIFIALDMIIAYALAIMWVIPEATKNYIGAFFRTDYSVQANDAGYFCVSAIVLLVGLLSTWIRFDLGGKLKSTTQFFTIAAFVLAFLAHGVGYVSVGIAPFGTKNVLLIDMYHQYAPFFIDLKDRLFNGESFLIDKSVALGTSYLPLFAYYLASPFNIIAMFFPKENMTEAIALIEVLKTASCAATFSIFLRGVFKKNDWTVVMLSLMYSLTSYMLAYCWNIMWFDCLVMLPLVALGMHKLLKEGKYLLYSISLGVCLMSNFYIGFMVCITMVVYFISLVIAQEKSWKSFFIKCGRFAGGSLMGGGLSAFIILPTYLALQLTSSANDTLPATWENNFDMLSLAGQHLFSVPLGVDFGEMPNIYCGVIVLVLIPLALMNKKIPLRQKIADLFMLGVMFFSLTLNLTDWVWHGLHYPNGLPYRFAFVYIFAAVIIAARAIFNIEATSPKHVWLTGGVIGAFILVLEYTGAFEDDFRIIYISLLFAAAYCTILLLGTDKKRWMKACTTVLAFVVIFEMCSHTVLGIQRVNERYSYGDKSGFYSSNELLTATFEEIEMLDPNGEYRAEHVPSKTCNDAAFYSYRGLDSFASSSPLKLITFLDRLGYANNGVNSHLYHTFSPVSDSMLGLKYFVTRSNLYDHPQLKMVDALSDDTETLYIYENSSALPIGYAVEPLILQSNWRDNNPFRVMNELIRTACGVDGVYEIYDLFIAESKNASAEMRAGDTIAVNVTDMETTGSATAGVQLDQGGQVYVFADMPYLKTAYLRTETGTTTIGSNEPYVADAGVMAAGQHIGITVEVNYNTTGCVAIARLNEEKFNQAMALLASEPMNVELQEDDHIKGTITVNNDKLLMTSIPYDEGWTVKVDGQKVDVKAVGEALIAVDLTAGTHTIEMTFFPKGLAPGIIITLLSVAALVYVTFIWPKKKKVTAVESDGDDEMNKENGALDE